MPTASSLAPVLSVLLAIAAVAQAKADLGRARSLLQATAGKDVKEGTEMCVRANDVPAVELMLEMMEETDRRTRLHHAPGHYRDYVHWNRVTRHLADLDRFHKVTVHTVAYTDNEWFRDQLQKIAEVTGGHFEWLK